jgi:hypothetical protein
MSESQRHHSESQNPEQHDDALKAYLFGEQGAEERQQTEELLRRSAEAGEELERLRLTEAALRMLPEQEPSHRIAFVSDKVLEPRWWQRVWAPGPRWGFASAMLLAGAIVLHGWMTASPQPATPAQSPLSLAQTTNASSATETLVSEAEMEQRIAAAVARAVEQVEARQARKTAELVAAAERRMQEQNQSNMVAVQESFEVLSKRLNVMYLASNDLGGAR